MPIAAGKGHCTLGVDGARHLETASQAIHAGGCLPGEDCKQSSRQCSRGPQGWPYILFYPTTLGPQSHCIKTSSLPLLLGILEGCCHQEKEWPCRNRGLKDKRHSLRQLSQCLFIIYAYNTWSS